MRLFFSGCVVGALIVFGACQTESAGTQSKQTKTWEPAFSELSVDGALAWRNTYGDLLGKPREAVIERFGTPNRNEDGNSLEWDRSEKTDDRGLTIFFDSVAQKGSIAQGVKVFSRPAESLDALEILKRAQMFEFTTGTYEDTVLNYFTATTKDGRNAFQFDVHESGVYFRAMIFVNTDALGR